MAVSAAVIVDNNLDGAAAGAAVLLKHNGGRVFVSSAWNLPARIANLQEWEQGLKSVFICGIGCKRSPNELAEAMNCLKDRGVSITWFLAGAGCPDCETQVGRYCSVKRLEDAHNVTDVVKTSLKLETHPRMRLLQTIADAGRCEKIRDREARTAAELAVASMFRFFQAGDRDAYPAAVRKMAGLAPITDDDLRLIRHQNSMGFMLGPDGSSPQIKEIRRRVAKFAGLDCLNVLILGETGTGKEKVARLLHRESRRAGHPFVPINCANLTGTEMLESKLFGHVTGAFTGAVADSEGFIEAADGGILFLDEIAEMPLDTQAKLLRVIEDGTYTKLGSSQERKSDVRVVAATNKELSVLVREGRFRIDLYYRLRELVIHLPPLRERLSDLGQIAGSVKRGLQQEQGGKFPDLTDEQIALLRNYSWPGNVRQLQSVLRRAYLLGVDEHLAEALRDEIDEHLDTPLNRPSPEGTPWPRDSIGPAYDWTVREQEGGPAKRTLRESQCEYAMAVLQSCGGNLTRAAKVLDISVNTLKKLRREAGSKGPGFQQPGSG
jgi:DNA-binding NtrC family response regulator